MVHGSHPPSPSPVITSPLVQAEHLSRIIGARSQKTVILDDVTFAVASRILFAITGPSGSGKSTLLNLLTGIDRPTTGRVIFAGEELRAKGENALAQWRGVHVGIIFQFFQLLPTLTALENVLLALELGQSTRRDDQAPRRRWGERAMTCLELVGLQGFARRLPSELSVGQQQRVAIARALANDPPVLVADEPTGNLDSDMRVIFSDPSSFAKIADQLAALPNLAHVEQDGATNAATAWGTISVSGYEPDTALYHPQLTSGRWLQPDDTNVVLLSDDLARHSGLHVGDTLAIQNNFGTSTQVNLTIVGTLDQSITNLGWVGAAVVPINTLYELRGVPSDQVASSTLQVEIEAGDRSPAAVDALAAQVNALVNPDGSSADGQGYFTGNGATVDTMQEYVSRRSSDVYVLYYMLYAVALLVAVAGILGLANALSAAVLERRREIGILRTIGATSRRVARVFWTEGMALGALSWGCGAVLGVPLAYAFVHILWQTVFPVHFAIDAVAFIVMLVAVMGGATFATILPALRASHLRLAEILRYE